ncbi:MAG: penicillin acylase family protein [Deltaproteobacteria bacterium]|nr:penicillin acylase family protein [Deltaproteobacteria bacterium]
MRHGVLLAALLLVPSIPVAREGGKKVTIIRDERGVPHVHASDVRSLFYGVGYAQGQDRLWQAETLRRAGTGTLAEWFGQGSLASDVQTRTLFGPPARRAALLASASPEVRTIFQAFADGMNAWIAEATATGKLPLEYAAFHVAPRPWTTDDSVAVYMLLGSQFGWFGSDELDNAVEYGGLVARLGPTDAARAFADTHWLEDPSAPTTDPAPAARGRGHEAPRAASLPAGAEEAGRRHRAQREEAEKARGDFGIRRGPMSNAILIGPRLSRDGRPLLLGGPQMGYSAPQINHEMGIHGAGFDITGIQIAGWPLVVIGVGKGYAWSLTSGGTDNSDIFAEQLDPQNPGRYRWQGGWKDLDCRVEEVPVAGQAAVSQTLCRSVHGPIVGVQGGTAFAFANTTFGNELSSYEAWLNISRVKNIDEFEKRLAGIAYNFNVMYADAAGNIAHWHIGKFPVRAAGANPFFPQPGDGSSEWQGTVPFADQPHSRNPRQGWLASWNNKPGPGWKNSSAGFWAWGPVQRVNTLRRLLGQVQPRSATTDTLAAINRQAGLTTQSPSDAAHAVFVSTLLGRMLDAVDSGADARLPGALALLSSWDWLQKDDDGDGRYDSPAVAVFNGWWARAVEALFVPVQGSGLDASLYGQLLMRLFQGPDAALPLQADYLAGRSLDEVLTASLVATLDGLAATYGSTDMADWLQPRAEIFWKPGGIGSVPNTLWMNRGTYNQIVHLGHGDDLRAWNVVSPGQSGDFRSPHFADQLALYAGWTYKPMRITRRDQERNAESVTRLTVP